MIYSLFSELSPEFFWFFNVIARFVFHESIDWAFELTNTKKQNKSDIFTICKFW